MTDIKVGDWVVTNNSHRLWEVKDINEDEELAKIYSAGFGGVWFSIDKIRPATPAEIAAGHRIDEPVLTQQENTPEALQCNVFGAGHESAGSCSHPPFERGLCVDGKQPCLRCDAMVESGKVYEPMTVEQFNAAVFPKTESCNHEDHYACKHCARPQTLIEHCQQCADEVASWPEDKKKAASVISVTALNTTTASPRHDLHQYGAKVHDEWEEAVKSSRERFEAIINRRYVVINLTRVFGDSNEYVNQSVQTAWICWQHQQAVVDEQRDEIEYQKAERKREQDAAWSTHDEQVRIIKQQDDKVKELQNLNLHTARQFNDQRDTVADLEYKNKELQKRVEAVESTLREARDRAEKKGKAAKNSEIGAYWGGVFNALDTALHSLGFKDSHDEAGKSHETP